jgi:hypothetical protein
MDQKNATAAILLTYLTQPATMAQHLDMLMAMLNTAIQEKKDVEDRKEVSAEIFRGFVQLCAEMWKCSYEEATKRCGDEWNEYRGDEPSGDTVLKMPYTEYLQSHWWQGVRHYALLRADYRCQICNSSDRLEVHHRTYERRGGEDYRDVIALCHNCHERFHKRGPHNG